MAEYESYASTFFLLIRLCEQCVFLKGSGKNDFWDRRGVKDLCWKMKSNEKVTDDH